MDEWDITTIAIAIERGGTTALYAADLIQLEGMPHVVIEWQDRDDGTQTPAVTVPLDPQYLQPLEQSVELAPDAEWLYRIPIRDPRRFD